MLYKSRRNIDSTIVLLTLFKLLYRVVLHSKMKVPSFLPFSGNEKKKKNYELDVIGLAEHHSVNNASGW